MQASLDDSTLGYSACDIENDITVFCPLRDCLLELRKKFSVVGQAHGERAAQVKSTAGYSSSNLTAVADLLKSLYRHSNLTHHILSHHFWK